jgi:hypothetical protein
MSSPMPDVSADWGYPHLAPLDVSGLDVSKATEPADPMHLLPGTGAPVSGSPVPGDVNAPWGYPGHGEPDL